MCAFEQSEKGMDFIMQDYSEDEVLAGNKIIEKCKLRYNKVNRIL